VSIFGNKNRDGEPDEESPAPGLEASERAPAPPPARPNPKASNLTAEKTPMRGEGQMANIGKSISIKGDLTGEEDVLVEGKVEGKIDLPENELTIGANGNVHADVHAKTVMVIGRVAGNVSGGERVEIQTSGIVEGDVRAPRLIVQEGAVVNGSISMETKAGSPRPEQPKTAASPPKHEPNRPVPPPA
jgi:cytoskeletal protein CcmA (bactofilin family)